MVNEASKVVPKTRTTKLNPNETIAARRRRQKLEDDSFDVARVVSKYPGIPSKIAIADHTTRSLTPQRVAQCIKAIKARKVDGLQTYVAYGHLTVKGGPWAGEIRWGWFPMDRASYQPVMDQADAHVDSVEVGVRWGRLQNLAQARGLPTKKAAAVVRSVEERLDERVEALSKDDLEAFEDLVIEEAENA